jgi:hypothetical protein
MDRFHHILLPTCEWVNHWITPRQAGYLGIGHLCLSWLLTIASSICCSYQGKDDKAPLDQEPITKNNFATQGCPQGSCPHLWIAYHVQWGHVLLPMQV